MLDVLEVEKHGLVVQRVDGYAPVLAQLEVDVRAGRARQRWVAARADAGAIAGEERRDLRALRDDAVAERERRRGDERRGGGQEGSASGHCEAESEMRASVLAMKEKDFTRQEGASAPRCVKRSCW